MKLEKTVSRNERNGHNEKQGLGDLQYLTRRVIRGH